MSQSTGFPFSQVKKMIRHALARSPMSDADFARVIFFIRYHRWLNLKHPVSLMEKLQWYKVKYDLRRYRRLADKLAVRDYVADRIGGKYLVRLFGTYESADQIDFNQLPERFVLKATHGCKMNWLCWDKSSLDIIAVRDACRRWLATDHSINYRERIYEGIKPRLIAEDLLHETPGICAPDYKIFCFHGIPKYIEVDVDRYTLHRRNFYDLDWRLLPFIISYPNADRVIDRPKRLEEMLEISQMLSKDIPFVRVDLYQVAGRSYFGELTFTPQAGFARVSRENDIEMGKWWRIDRVATLTGGIIP